MKNEDRLTQDISSFRTKCSYYFLRSKFHSRELRLYDPTDLRTPRLIQLHRPHDLRSFPFRRFSGMDCDSQSGFVLPFDGLGNVSCLE